MATRVCYCLKARSPFHFGERGLGMEEASVLLHADTLFSALCLTLGQRSKSQTSVEGKKDLEDLLGAFPRCRFAENQPFEYLAGNPPFRLSSAFPFWAKEEGGKVVEKMFFFPKPFLTRETSSGNDRPAHTKAWKRVQFVTQSIFEALLAGENVDLETTIQGGKIWLTPQEKEKIAAETLWVEDVRPHVTVDRITSASQVYAVGLVRFRKSSGLFFLIDYEDEAWREALETALFLLGESGIGGERSSGCGQFDLEVVKDFSLRTPPSQNAFTILSPYWPLQEEVKAGVLTKASYGLLMRRGWIGSTGGMNLRRRSVRMLSEGAVFPKQPVGALVDVKPLDPEEVPNVSHDVWRYGVAFSVACQRAGEGQNV